MMIFPLVRKRKSASETTFGTFANSDNGTQAFGTSGLTLGVKFTAPITGGIDQVIVELTANSGSVRAQLWSDSSDAPGAQIGSDSSTSASTGEVTLTWASAPAITASTAYWIIFRRVGGSGGMTAQCVDNHASFVTRYDASAFNNPPGLGSGDELSDDRDVRFEATVS